MQRDPTVLAFNELPNASWNFLQQTFTSTRPLTFRTSKHQPRRPLDARLARKGFHLRMSSRTRASFFETSLYVKAVCFGVISIEVPK